MNQLSEYPKIHQIYHRETTKMHNQPVVIQEKVDGSQISFGKKDGVLWMKSKNRMIDVNAPDGMFMAAVECIKEINLPENHVFRGEYLNRPKHNVLEYQRIPHNTVIIYDIEVGDGTNDYMIYEDVQDLAEIYGFETVPTLWIGSYDDVNQDLINRLLESNAYLGKTLIEGIVIKCYGMYDCNDHVLMCKFVRPEFKEMNGGKADKPRAAIVDKIGSMLNNTARWTKSVQHLKDDGVLVGDACDIGLLMKELNKDFEEHRDEIKALLYAEYRKKILRVANAGFAEWYKQRLTEEALGTRNDIPHEWYVTHIHSGENFVCRGPHDETGHPEIQVHFSDKALAEEVVRKLMNGEEAFIVGDTSVSWCEGNLQCAPVCGGG